ncbi:hypothetical protein [Paludibaculum fermentans]|uniref:hypothetical protein n=1 Tax=Paludibaculum fermentans TaxID=1473598 RepID=UPI003EBCE2E9
MIAAPKSIYNRIGMGLEVWVYAGLTKADNVEVDRDGYPKDWSRYWRAVVVNGTEFSYPGRAAGLEQDAIYEYTNQWDFVAGTAKTYNAWRDALARLAGYESAQAVVKSPPPPGSPFVEMIDFFDHGGVLGPVVCGKLARDFAAFQAKARAVGGGFYALYYVWHGAFEATAGNGALRFAGAPDPDQVCRVCGCTDDDIRGYKGPLEAVPHWAAEDLCSTCEKAMYAAKFDALPSPG